MSSLALDAAIADLIETLSPAEAAKLQKVVEQVVNRSGGVNRETVLGLLPTLVSRWEPSDAGGDFVPQASTVMGLTAYANTAPSTGNALITLSIERPGAGREAIGTVQILQGEPAAVPVTLAQDAPAGSWLFATVTTANGASGVTIVATRRLT